MNSNKLLIIQECLNAMVHGPFIEDWEFSTLVGMSRREVHDILVQWPNVNTKDETVLLAINNCFNNLIGYPINHPEKWSEYLSVTKEQLAEKYKEWRDEVYGPV